MQPNRIPLASAARLAAMAVTVIATLPAPAWALGHATTEATIKLQFQGAQDAVVQYSESTFDGTMKGYGNHAERISPTESLSDTLYSAQFMADAIADAPPTSFSQASNTLKTSVLATASNNTDHALSFTLDAFYDISVYMAADSYSWAKTSYGLNISGKYSQAGSPPEVQIFKTRESSSTYEPHEAIEKLYNIVLRPGEAFTLTNNGATVGAAAFSSLVPESGTLPMALSALGVLALRGLRRRRD